MTAIEKMTKLISVDARHLERVFGLDLHEFEEGHQYPLAKLMNALGFAKGTRQGRSRGKKKQEDTPVQERDSIAQEHPVRIIPLEKKEGEQ